MNKRKKTIVAIFVVLFLIIGTVALFRFKIEKDYEDQIRDDTVESGKDEENSVENTEGSNEEEVQVQLVENEGDLEIIISEDMESDGF